MLFKSTAVASAKDAAEATLISVRSNHAWEKRAASTAATEVRAIHGLPVTSFAYRTAATRTRGCACDAVSAVAGKSASASHVAVRDRKT